MKIRRRLAWYGAGVTAVGLIVFGGLILTIARGGVIDTQDAALDTLVAQAVANLEAGDDPAAAVAFLEQAELESPYLEVLADDGSLLAHTAPESVAPFRVPAAVLVEAIELGESTLVFERNGRVQVRPWTSSTRTGVVAGVATPESVEVELVPVRALVFGSAILTLIAATVVSWLVSGRALRPLRDLAATTDDIGSTGDLTRRLPAVDADDEVGTLTRSFNAMLDEIEASRGRLADSLEGQRRFIADASHELRSPLTTIRSNAGFLSERPDAADKDRTEAIDDIRAEADRMATLVDNLLMLARSDAGQELRSVPVDLTEIALDAARRAQRLGYDVTAEIAEPAVTLGDPEALDRVVWILVDNATKHGATPVSIRTKDDGTRVQLAVSDSGGGIPQEHLGQVFERFHRADDARSPSGSGLGLSIARDIVLRHGGMLTATNRPTGGAVFSADFDRA